LMLFQTAIGGCGIAWRGDMIVATHLPEPSEEATRARLAVRAGGGAEGEPHEPVRRAIGAIVSLLDGAKADLSFIDCDFGRLNPLDARIYDATRRIPPGETLTYGEIAASLGDKSLAQAVGQALGRNPFPIIVPCHRVMGAGGRLTGFSANGGVETKLRMLGIEGARIGAGPGLFDELPLAVKPGRTR
ncbi:MAG: methylated-DNA--[protein]-cysteine S-methyltransferase, partial [Beijerinckiaceae bacterium]